MKTRKLSPGIPLPPFRAAAGGSEEKSVVIDKVAEEIGSQQIDSPSSFGEADKTLIDLDVSLIDQNRFAPREVYTPEMILQRAESLRVRQNDPIHVIPNPESPGRYIIADGWTRVLACRAHQARKTLLAKVHYGLTEEEAAWLGYEQNESRQQHCDYDRAMFYEKMIAQGLSINEIAQRAGITRQNIHLYRSFSKLPDEIKEIIKTHPSRFGALAAYNIFRLSEKCGVRKAVNVALTFAEENRPVRWLTNYVETQLAESKRQGRADLIRHIRYDNGFLKQKGDKFEIVVKVPQEQIEHFAQEIERVLSPVVTASKSSSSDSDEPQQPPDGGGSEDDVKTF